MKSALVMISCMHENINIIKKSNLYHDVLVINQCDVDNAIIRKFSNNIVWIDTPTRGLSRSRNIALKYAQNDICLIADDDEYFKDGIQEKVFNIFEAHPEADVIVFPGINFGYKSDKGYHELSFVELFHINSKSIAIRLDSIKRRVSILMLC